MKKKMIIGWILAVIITLAAAYYQRITGPTYPKKISVELNNKMYNFSLLRSHSSSDDCDIKLEVKDKYLRGFMIYRKYPTLDNWDTLPMQRNGDFLSAYLPKQLPAGKLEYYFVFRTGVDIFPVLDNRPVVIRYKGDVPAYVLLPHILFIFIAMLLSNLAGILGAFKLEKARLYTFATFIALLLGGMILGPIVQKFAFGEFWTGVPYGWDLTDNKTLIAFLAWIIALLMNRKKYRPAFIIGAAIVTLIIFSIPHSMFGSELNHASGSVTTGR